MATTKCVYSKISSNDGYDTVWRTNCGKHVKCESPEVVGMSFTPLPTENGEFCHYCGGKIVLSTRDYDRARRTEDSVTADNLHNQARHRYLKVKLLWDMRQQLKDPTLRRMCDEIMDEIGLFEAANLREGRPPVYLDF